MKKTTMLLGSIVMAILMLGGCSGGDIDKSSGETDEGSEDKVPETPDSGDTDEEQDDTTDEGPSFMDFADMRQDMSYKATYEFSSTISDNVPEDVTMYIDHPQKRIDSVVNMNGVETEARLFMDEDSYSACSKQEGSWMCLSLSKDEFSQKSSGAGMTSQKVGEAETNPEDYRVSYEGTKQVAGKSSDCYEIVPKEDSWRATTCYTEDAMIAYAEMENEEGVSTMEATELSKDVSAEDFELPAEPKDMGDMIPEGMQS